jgi:group I intron endonuclease
MFEFINEKKYENMFGIYEIRNVETECVYIGQTRQPFKKRFFYHRWQLRTNKHENPYLQSSYNKHGEDAFQFSVLKVVTDPSMLDQYEMEEIAKAKETGKCYNMLAGGGGRPGIPLSEERRKELGALNKILNTGKKASEETRKKMSEKRKGIKRTKEDMDKAVNTRINRILSGDKKKTQKITPDQARSIKQDIMNNMSYTYLAEKYNVSYSNINAIRSNRSWKYVDVDGWDEYCENNKNNVRARQSRSAN